MSIIRRLEKISSDNIEKTYDYMSRNNDPKYNLLKASEELQELSLILTQRVNKGKKVSTKSIIDEIGDVEIRLEVLKRIFTKEAVASRVEKKLSQMNSYRESGRYKNI